MGILNSFFGRKDANTEQSPKAKAPVSAMDRAPTPLILADTIVPKPKPRPRETNAETIKKVADTVGEPRQSGVNIWDLEDDAAEATAEVTPIRAASAQAAHSVAAPDRAASRARRNRTRLLGFDTSEGASVDVFEASKQVSPTERVQFPVGWILVTEGPGRGHCFALTAGMAQIGRGEDQAIQLDFGDAAISRNNHAAIVFDAADSSFLLGHGGKANIVRLNGKPVISNETLSDGDKIMIGETVLLLKTLISDDFSWDAPKQDEENDDDLAIA
ncbi:MAG: FHA domain-containing protein [Sedimentitalea sp.]